MQILFGGRGRGEEEETGGLVEGKKNKTQHLPVNHILAQIYNKARVGKRLDGALCGLDHTGRTLSTYRGSCDRVHSVFLLLFWWGMDLKKQKRWGYRHTCLKPSEVRTRLQFFYFFFVTKTWPGPAVLEQKFIFHHNTVPPGRFPWCKERRQKTILTVGGQECTLGLILLLRFEVTQQDTGSILHLTMRQADAKKRGWGWGVGEEKTTTTAKKIKIQASRHLRGKSRGFDFAQ